MAGMTALKVSSLLFTVIFAFSPSSICPLALVTKKGFVMIITTNIPMNRMAI
jgi:hypothetical protein